MTKRIRFWIYIHSDTLVTLQAGETLRHSAGGETDEGWSRESNVLTFDGQKVVCEWCRDGRDCDGRLTRSGISWFSVGEEKAGWTDPETGIAHPRWRESESS